MNGTPACVYDIADGAGDTMRTILFDTGDRLYAVALLLMPGPGADGGGGVWSAEELRGGAPVVNLLGFHHEHAVP